MLSEPIRAWLYRICIAVVPLLVMYGVISESTTSLWIGVLGALLGAGQATLAATYTSTTRKHHNYVNFTDRNIDLDT